MPKSADFWEQRLETVNVDIVRIELELALRLPLKNPRLPLVRNRRKGEAWTEHRNKWRRQIRTQASLKRQLAKLLKRKAYIEERLQPKTSWERLLGKPVI